MSVVDRVKGLLRCSGTEAEPKPAEEPEESRSWTLYAHHTVTDRSRIMIPWAAHEIAKCLEIYEKLDHEAHPSKGGDT